MVERAETNPAEETLPEKNETQSTQPQENTEPVMLPEYAEIYAQNDDLVGWICIADTRINYPVMSSLDMRNYYLDHGFDKAENGYGCLYMAEICDVSKPLDNLIIYGHHKKNGIMFSDLKSSRKRAFGKITKPLFSIHCTNDRPGCTVWCNRVSFFR